MKARIAAVLNRVHAAHSHQPAVAEIFGDSTARLLVAYTKKPLPGSAADHGKALKRGANCLLCHLPANCSL